MRVVGAKAGGDLRRREGPGRLNARAWRRTEWIIVSCVIHSVKLGVRLRRADIEQPRFDESEDEQRDDGQRGAKLGQDPRLDFRRAHAAPTPGAGNRYGSGAGSAGVAAGAAAPRGATKRLVISPVSWL